jgi:hypothetical protein
MPNQKSVSLPVTPVIPAQVNPGDKVLAGHENTVSQAIADLWTNQQAIASAAGAVASVFGRTGAVVAASGDYTAAQITNAVSSVATYADPAWITSLAYSKLTGVPAAGVSSVFGRSGAVVAVAGDYTAAQITNAVSTAGSYADPAWITSLSYAKLAGSPTAGQIAAMQTPWQQPVSAAGFTLSNVPTVSGNGNLTVAAGGAGIVAFQTNAVERMRIDASGNVGIGTTSPGVTFDCIGSSGGINARFTDSLASSPRWMVVCNGSEGPRIEMWSNATPTYAASVGMSTPSVASTPDLIFCMYNAGWAERMRLTNAGNVGIGTTNINGALTVNTGAGWMLNVRGDYATMGLPSSVNVILQPVNTAQSAEGSLCLHSNGLYLLGGNVGIGTTTPGATLDVAGSARISTGIEVDNNISQNLYWSGSNWIYRAAGIGLLIAPGSSYASFYFGPAGSAGATASNQEMLRFGSTSNWNYVETFAPAITVLTGPGSPVETAMPNNGLTICTGSNTQLLFRFKGSDGVIRQGALTLS